MSAYVKINTDVIKRLKKAIENVGRDFDAVLSRDVLTLYKNAQAQRFKTSNASETGRWKELNPNYKAWKRKAARRFPGGGQVMGIFTSRLYKAATMQNLEDTSAITRGRSLFINITVPYAGYFDQVRTISQFGPKTRQSFKDRVAKYISKQVKGG